MLASRRLRAGDRLIVPGRKLRELVADAAFSNWTTDNVLRHPSFEGLREGKSAREAAMEKPNAIAPRAR